MEHREGSVHRPVMSDQVMDLLAEGEVEVLLDATVGLGGHAARFLSERGAGARVIGLDRDPEVLAVAAERLSRFGEQVRLVVASFADTEDVLDREGVAEVDGALFDLGVNSVHFDEGERGFSFLSPGPLDMRFSREDGETADAIVNGASRERLTRLLADLGDEPRAARIAGALVAERPIRDTLRLADVVARAVGHQGRKHPATRTFQALRMAVNRELEHIERGIPAALRRLRPGGRMVVLSYHSGEDRMVKRLLREEAWARPLLKRPLRPDSREVRENPRARSARLRACERVREDEA